MHVHRRTGRRTLNPFTASLSGACKESHCVPILSGERGQKSEEPSVRGCNVTKTLNCRRNGSFKHEEREKEKKKSLALPIRSCVRSNFYLCVSAHASLYTHTNTNTSVCLSVCLCVCGLVARRYT